MRNSDIPDLLGNQSERKENVYICRMETERDEERFMSRLEVKMPGQAQAVVEQLYRNMDRRQPSGPVPCGYGAEFPEPVPGPDLRQVRALPHRTDPAFQHDPGGAGGRARAEDPGPDRGHCPGHRGHGGLRHRH